MRGSRFSGSFAALPVALLAACFTAGCETTGPATPAATTPQTEVATDATAPEPVVAPVAPDRLDGTEWTAVSMVGDVVGLDALEVAFQGEGRLVLTFRYRNGTTATDERTYEVDGSRLTVRDAVGAETSISFRRFGDELTLDAPQARVALRQVGGPAEAETTLETRGADIEAIADEPDHPLRGTEWSLVSTMGNVSRVYVGGMFEFRSDGWLIMTLERSDGPTNRVERRYRASGETVVFLDPLGSQTPARISRRDDRLILDLPHVRLNLRRSGG